MKNLKEILIFLEFPLTQIIKISKNKNIFTLHLKNNSSFNLGYQCREIIINKNIIKKGWYIKLKSNWLPIESQGDKYIIKLKQKIYSLLIQKNKHYLN